MLFSIKNLRPATALFVSFLFVLPFLVTNTIAVTGMEPMYSWLVGLGPRIIFAVLVLGFIGGIVALIPLFQKDSDGKRRFFVLNALVGVGLITFFIILGHTLGEEIYRCDILKIPNCD